MEDLLARIFENLIGRVSGPMKFRLILQPLMAIIFAVRSGLKDAKEGKPPYFWALFTHPAQRRQLPWSSQRFRFISWTRWGKRN